MRTALQIGYESVVPSEAIAFLGESPTAVKAIVSILTEVIKLKVDYSVSCKLRVTVYTQKCATAARLNWFSHPSRKWRATGLASAQTISDANADPPGGECWWGLRRETSISVGG